MTEPVRTREEVEQVVSVLISDEDDVPRVTAMALAMAECDHANHALRGGSLHSLR